MNLENLRDHYPKLIACMEANGYSKTYVDRFKREIKKILSDKNSKQWSCYSDVYLEYAKKSQSHDYLRGKRTIIGAIEQFDVHGRYPDGRHRHELFKRGAYPLLSPEFKSIIDNYCEAEKKRGKKAANNMFCQGYCHIVDLLSFSENDLEIIMKIILHFQYE
ncbi:MAG: hypothetical protein ACYC2T_15950 [Bacillota bacterium]